MSVRLNERRARRRSEIDIIPNQVHLWNVDLSPHDEPPDQARTPLSREEWQRAERFRFRRDRRRFIGRRLFLRNVLSSYTADDPAAIELCTTGFGKPYLAGGSTDRGITFNLSHSGEIVVVAIARDRAVGIDVETPTRAIDIGAIARHFFSRGETAQLESMPTPQRAAAFLRLWTAKEALLKATGHGLSVPLNRLEFTAESDAGWRAAYAPTGNSRSIDWTILHRTLPKGAVVAAAAAAADWSLVWMDGACLHS